MRTVKRSGLRYLTMGSDATCSYAILRENGTVYDTYADLRTARRVLADLGGHYDGLAFEVVEVVDG